MGLQFSDEVIAEMLMQTVDDVAGMKEATGRHGFA
jgi:hypothetical protein